MADSIVGEIACALPQFDRALNLAKEINEQRRRMLFLVYQVTRDLKDKDGQGGTVAPVALALSEILEDLLDSPDQHESLIAQLSSIREDGVAHV